MAYLRTRWRRSGMTPKTVRSRKPDASLQGGYAPPRHPSHRNDEGHRGVMAVWTGSAGTLVLGAIDFACRSLGLFQMRGIGRQIRVSKAGRLSLPIRTPRPTGTPPTGTSRRVCTNKILGGVPPAAAEGLACRPPHPPAQAADHVIGEAAAVSTRPGPQRLRPFKSSPC